MVQDISLADLTGAAAANGNGAADISAVDGSVLDAAHGALTPASDLDDQIARLPQADRDRIAQLADAIDFTKQGIESSYAKDAQRATSSFADDILAKVRSKDAGQAGDLLQELLTTVDKAELGAVSNVPILGSLLGGVDRLRRRYQKVSSQIDEIVSNLERQQTQLVADIAMYDTIYAQNAEQYRQLKTYVLAGKSALRDFNAEQLPKLEAQAQESGDPMQAQVLTDFKSRLDRFAKRLDDLDRVSVVTLQTAPQIKIIQNADQTVVDKIDTTISTTIPVWKSQMVIALGLENQRKALDLQKQADDVTNKMLQQNARTLHQGAVDAERANQRSVIDTETLERVNSELIATLKETVQIQQQGKANRAAAETKMRQIESDLKAALLDNAQQLR